MSGADNITGCGGGNSPVEALSPGMIRLRPDLVVVYLDPAAGRLLEVPAEELLGRRIDEVVDLANLVNLIRCGISFSNQVLVSGARRLACDYSPVIEDEKIVGGVLTLLRLLPETSSGPSDDLKELLRSSGDFMNLDYDGIIVVDLKGNVVMVNQAFAELFDTTPQSMIGKHVSQSYRNSQPSRLPMVMQTGKPQIGITHYLNGKQVYASLFPLIKDGTLIGALGKILFKDVREITLIANQLHTAPETHGDAAQPRNHARGAAPKAASFRYDVNSIVGQSAAMVELKETLLRVAQKNSTVLLVGESGTGKELFAHAIHAASNRRYAPFVKVNCAAIPEHLLESELFGYAEGAFTGAKKGGQIGKFEQAHTGTIFLDEIGDMPLYMQAKMLRVLQERELTPLGSRTPRMVDVRVAAATHCNLEQLVKEGKFREDFYYRLKVVTLTVPPLRERREDIYPLTRSFIAQFNAEFGLEVQGLNEEAWDVIRSYHWPGNIRELRNVIESAFNSVSGPLIMREHLPEQLLLLVPGVVTQAETAPSQGSREHILACLGKKDLDQIVDEFEKLVLDTAMEMSQGNKLQAAQLLGISRQWLYKKLQKHHPH